MGDAGDEVVFHFGDFFFLGHIVEDGDDAGGLAVLPAAVEPTPPPWTETLERVTLKVRPLPGALILCSTMRRPDLLLLCTHLLDHLDHPEVLEDLGDGGAGDAVEVEVEGSGGGLVGEDELVEGVGDEDGVGDGVDDGLGVGSRVGFEAGFTVLHFGPLVGWNCAAASTISLTAVTRADFVAVGVEMGVPAWSCGEWLRSARQFPEAGDREEAVAAGDEEDSAQGSNSQCPACQEVASEPGARRSPPPRRPIMRMDKVAEARRLSLPVIGGTSRRAMGGRPFRRPGLVALLRQKYEGTSRHGRGLSRLG